jgi:uncharacterized lipoprotein YddW (UPF0748 family)
VCFQPFVAPLLNAARTAQRAVSTISSRICLNIPRQPPLMRWPMNSKHLLLPWFLLPALAGPAGAAQSAYVASDLTPPASTREFRGLWVATVANLDWPSQPGLPVAQQQAELIAIFNTAARLNFNAVIFQVRPSADAFYASTNEPWSYYLTGTMGRPPEPFYDPLAFAITEAHRRGLELHAWFNPFRAGHPSAKPPIASNHVSQTHPELVRSYGQLLWLDPGERDVQDLSARVVLGVVRRYAIDGVQFDDYFYPYKEKDAQQRDIPFPDGASWQKFGAGGKLSRDDWRRENINGFVQRIYQSIKAAKPWVKFGISPFGIWQPGYPSTIAGKNAYEELYSDSRKWLINGWVDYWSPQLYWEIQKPATSFPVLLKWWEGQNPMHRHIWPGLASYKVGEPVARWKPQEILSQIRIVREQSADPGNIQWRAKTLLENPKGLDNLLAKGPYAEPALVPASPWLAGGAPTRPTISVENGRVGWEPTGTNRISWWLVQTQSGNRWTTAILPEFARAQTFTGSPDAFAVTAIDRCGVPSAPAVVQKTKAAAK